MSQKREKLIEELKKGYEEMAQINTDIAESAAESDNEALFRYEEKLTECD